MAQRSQGRMELRYEDVSQTGRLKCAAMPHGLGMVGFAKLLNAGSFTRPLRSAGILPILSRLRVESRAACIDVHRPVEVECSYRVGHVRDERGEVTRILLLLEGQFFGVCGSTHDPQPADAGARLHLGSAYAEHVFTRPFAARGQRKVTSFDLGDGPFVPGATWAQDSPLSLIDPPEEAEAVDPEPLIDPAPVVFALGHTDSNQHVNSVAYLQIFEDAALRRLSARGADLSRLALAGIELAYRKPCFAGERMSMQVRAFNAGHGFGAVLQLGPGPGAPGHCLGSVRFVAEP